MYKNQIAAYVPVCEQERSDKRSIYHYIEASPHNVLTRENELAHMTSSGFIMNEDLTKVLVIFHKVYQAWGWTGGHMDGDVDMRHVALKEAREETGLQNLRPLSKQLMSLDILPVWGHMKKGKYVSAHLHLNGAYVLIADEKEELVQNEEETEGVMWIEADKIGDYSTEPDLVVVYKKLINAARAYDPAKEPQSIKEPIMEAEVGFGKALKDTTIPIAVHEAQSAYYKAKLVKEVTFHTSKGVAGAMKKIFKKKK